MGPRAPLPRPRLLVVVDHCDKGALDADVLAVVAEAEQGLLGLGVEQGVGGVFRLVVRVRRGQRIRLDLEDAAAGSQLLEPEVHLLVDAAAALRQLRDEAEAPLAGVEQPPLDCRRAVPESSASLPLELLRRRVGLVGRGHGVVLADVGEEALAPALELLDRAFGLQARVIEALREVLRAIEDLPAQLARECVVLRADARGPLVLDEGVPEVGEGHLRKHLVGVPGPGPRLRHSSDATAWVGASAWRAGGA
mmetsp:Transcript_92437/g.199852  ORF Transcript_92437/g.199852 Transcript_92437/m.199852 type:complete len:251 (-) Transcript_92437:9-761(-)